MDDDEVGEAAHQINEHDDRGAADAVLKTEMNGAGAGASGPAATAGEAKPRPKMAGGSWAIQQMQGVQKQRLDNKPPLLARHQRNDAAANRERRAAEQAAAEADAGGASLPAAAAAAAGAGGSVGSSVDSYAAEREEARQKKLQAYAQVHSPKAPSQKPQRAAAAKAREPEYTPEEWAEWEAGQAAPNRQQRQAGVGETGGRPPLTCRNFAAGLCTYGDRCHFSHDGPAALQPGAVEFSPSKGASAPPPAAAAPQPKPTETRRADKPTEALRRVEHYQHDDRGGGGGRRGHQKSHGGGGDGGSGGGGGGGGGPQHQSSPSQRGDRQRGGGGGGGRRQQGRKQAAADGDREYSTAEWKEWEAKEEVQEAQRDERELNRSKKLVWCKDSNSGHQLL